MPVAYLTGKRANIYQTSIGKTKAVKVIPQKNESPLVFAKRAVNQILSHPEKPRFVVCAASDASFVPALVKHHLPWTSVIITLDKEKLDLASYDLDTATRGLGLPDSYGAPLSPIEYLGKASAAKALLANADYLMPVASEMNYLQMERGLIELYPHLKYFIDILKWTSYLFESSSEHTGLLALLADGSSEIKPGSKCQYRIKEKKYHEVEGKDWSRVVIPADCYELSEGAVIAPKGRHIFMHDANSWHTRFIWEGIDENENILGGMILLRPRPLSSETQIDHARFARALDWLKFQSEINKITVREWNIWKPLNRINQSVPFDEVRSSIKDRFPQAYTKSTGSDYMIGALCASDFWDFQYTIPKITYDTNGNVNFRPESFFGA